MDAMLTREVAKAQEAFQPFERIEGALDCGALVICDHATNAFPPGYGALGLPREALDRHIAYDIGAAWVARRLAERLGAPAILSTFSRLLIDANRGADDPTLVMRLSDGALIPGNARIEAREVERRRRLYWGPYRGAIEATLEAMLGTGEPPAILSIHSFTPSWRGAARPWKVGVLWDRDPRLPEPLMRALSAEEDLAETEIGDNEPYEGALPGDTINAVATARGLSNALIEVRQDLVAEQADAELWGDRLARIIAPLIAEPGVRAPQRWGSRAAPEAAAPSLARASAFSSA